MRAQNIFNALPRDRDEEAFDLVLQGDHVRIERIVSAGHTSPESGWYDQAWHEWVMVLRGQAVIEFEIGGDAELQAGDYVEIPAHTRHRVKWTAPDRETVWLAVHYGSDSDTSTGAD